MAVRPRPSSLTTEEVFNYLPTTGDEERLLRFRSEYGFEHDPPIPPFWHSVTVCIQNANGNNSKAKTDFQEIYGTPFTKNRTEQRKYLTAAYLLEKNSMDQLFDYAEENGYPLVNILHLKEDLPPVEEMMEDEQTFFDESNGVTQSVGPEFYRHSTRIKKPDPYQKLMDAINDGIDLTSNNKNFFVHTIFEKIPDPMIVKLKRNPENKHIRLITMIPYVFDLEKATPITRPHAKETHATIIICDISKMGVRRMCFAESNRIMWNDLFKKHEGISETELKTYTTNKFRELLSPAVETFLKEYTELKGVVKENIEILNDFAEQAGDNKYFLDLPVYNDFGPNCTRLAIYIMFYYCFVSTMSDELTDFAININSGKLSSLRLQMHNESRSYDKIKPLLYGLLLHAKDKERRTTIPQRYDGREQEIDPARVTKEMQDDDTADEKLRRIVIENQNEPKQKTTKRRTTTKQKKAQSGGKGKIIRYHEHLY